MFARSWLSALAVIPITSADSQPAGATLEPIKPWILNYAETECFAERQYGDPAAPTVVAFKASVAGDVYDILVARRGPAPKFAEHRDGTIDFGKGPIRVGLLQYATTDKKFAVQKYRLTGPVVAQARTATSVSFTVRDGPDSSFRLYAIPALFKGMDDCTANLRQYWNYDVEMSVVATSVRDLRRVFSSDDYPGEALWRDQEGTAIFVLLIDEKGVIAACDISKPSGVPTLDAMGCQVLRERAKFKPALDKSGKPVRSIFVTPPINWRLSG